MAGLIQNVNDIYRLLLQLRQESTAALKEKSVEIIDPNYTLDELPDLIRMIFQSEFEFFFNFKNIDQFGHPRVPNRGRPASGLGPWNLETDFFNVYILDMSVPKYTPQMPTVGQWGHWVGGCDYNPSLKNISTITFEFNEDIFPEEFHPALEEETPSA